MVCQKCAKNRKCVSPGKVDKVDPPGNMAQKLKMHHVLMCTGIIFGNKKRRRKKRTFSNAADFGNMQDTESDIIAIWCQLFHYCQ